jgi:hypothetical protein
MPGHERRAEPPPLPACRLARKRHPAFGHLCKRSFANPLLNCKMEPSKKAAPL